MFSAQIRNYVIRCVCSSVAIPTRKLLYSYVISTYMQAIYGAHSQTKVIMQGPFWEPSGNGAFIAIEARGVKSDARGCPV